jgi:peptidoglycan/LPS O-acetylase OafA/YrhL
LPGVFEYYLDSRVNGALWTVPYEIFCYVLISILIITKFIQDARWTGCMTAAYFGGVCIVSLIDAPDMLPGRLQDLLKSLFLGSGARIVTAFLVGILFYQLRYKIPFSRVLFGVAAAFCVTVAVFAGSKIGRGVLIQPLLLPSLAYLTAFFGLSRVPIPKFFKTGDYSYGVYLYHDPMIHLVNT